MSDPSNIGYQVVYNASALDYANAKVDCAPNGAQIVVYQIIDHALYPAPHVECGQDSNCPGYAAAYYPPISSGLGYQDSPTNGSAKDTFQITAVAVIRVPANKATNTSCYDIVISTFFFQLGNTSRNIIQNNSMYYTSPNGAISGPYGTNFEGMFNDWKSNKIWYQSLKDTPSN